MTMGKRLGDILAKPADNLTYVWFVTIAIIMGLGFAAAVALLYAPK